MTQTVIHSQFEKYKAQEAAGGRRVVLDEFVFALVPDLDTSAAPDKNAAMPPDSQIAHRQAPDSAAMVNENAVTYTVTLGENLPPFSFNWLALCNREAGIIGMIIHMPEQKKLQTTGGMQGNVLTYAAIMEYEGAAEQTGITVSAASWQVDFSARLDGMDELTRLNAWELYGDALFFEDGFKVTADETINPATSTIAAGTAYIRGIRVSRSTPLTVTWPKKSGFILAMDVKFGGTLTGQHAAQVTIINQAMADYTDAAGQRHYVQPLAQVQDDGTLKDLRITGRPVMQFFAELDQTKKDLDANLEKINKDITSKVDNLDSVFLKKELLLKEISEAGEDAQKTARGYLGLGAETLLKQNNLSDVADKKTARDNLQITAENIGALLADNNGSDIPDKEQFKRNLNIRSGDRGIKGDKGDKGDKGNPGIPGPRGYGNANTASKSTSGWWKCGDTGLIIQWKKSLNIPRGGTIKFPIPFPNACFHVIITDCGKGWAPFSSHPANNTEYAYNSIPNSNNYSHSIIAIGY